MERQSSGSDSSLSVDESSSDSHTDPENLLDPTSSKFNPHIALHCEEKALKSYCQESPQFLHVFELEKAIPDPTKPPIKKSNLVVSKKRLLQKQLPASGSTESKDEKDGTVNINNPSTSSAAAEAPPPQDPKYPIPGRKFLAHQLPVYRPPKKHPNVITSMDEVEGPLTAVRKAMRSKSRVKVWTRNATGIRGYCTAFVLAFDHHWNLILRDVHEIFQRRRSDVQSSREEKGSEQQQQRQIERQDFRQGVYLRSVAQTHNNIHKPPANKSSLTVKDIKASGVRPILIDASDGLLVCRAHTDALTAHIPFQDLKSVNSAKLSSSDDIDIRTLTSAQIRKKRLTVFDEPLKDPFGFSILGRSKNYEIVSRYQKQLFLMGNEIVFIETLGT